MIESPGDSNTIKDTDIIFDCPNCGKSLAIDYRGAGLTIKCSDCGSEVQVPIPDGMELDDLDTTVEDQEMRIIQLRRSLQQAHERIAALEDTVEDLMQRRDALERDRSRQSFRSGEVLEKAGTVEQLLKDAIKALEALTVSFQASPEDEGKTSVSPA